MGEHTVASDSDERELRAFMKALLEDVHALELLLEGSAIETGIRRIGAEQEMFLVDEHMRPAEVALEVLERANDERLTTELACFNLEANLPPLEFGGDCLRRMEADINEMVEITRTAAEGSGARVLLCGILPTLRKGDLTLASMTPNPRYAELNDDLNMTHDNVMFEACNTSFQIHFQVGPEEAIRLYNIAQAITAPVLAAAVNSPLFLGRRLWNETRIALFEGSVDTRSDTHHERGQKPRVQFGDAWVRDSVLEIFKEDITRFRVVIAGEREENPVETVRNGGVPKLSALRLHNGTIYRWNRLCYGISGEGIPHLRIENRALPSGPTVLDEMANAAFFFGLMAAFAEECPNIEERMRFDDAKSNFFAAARHGLSAQFTWMDRETRSAADLILTELLPLARKGLAGAGIATTDVDRYLGVIEARVASRQTGSHWVLESLEAMSANGKHKSSVMTVALATAMYQGQQGSSPVHEWPLLEALDEGEEWRDSFRTVGQIMSRDLFTVRPGDIIDLAANVMDWKHVRHVPVENDAGELVGLVSHRALLRVVARGLSRDKDDPITVEEIMRGDPLTATPETPTLEVIALMKEHRVSCVPVVDGTRLVGIVTERDLIEVSARLLENFLENG
jgi:CBS domain-containing protein/gamma-glutamyl:cysteine ligase YbdK (ATP-grasp superfamily)